MSERANVETVWEQLAEEGYADREKDAAVRAVLEAQQENDSPWYVQGLAGCGGWIAAIFFFSFAGCWISLLGTSLWETPVLLGTMFSLTGAGAIVGVIRLRRNTQSMVAKQFALAVVIAAQVLIGVGLYLIFDEGFDGEIPVVSICLAIIAIQLPVLYYYRDSLMRFLAIIAIVTACNVLVWVLNIPGGLSVIVLATALGTAFLLTGLLPQALEVRYFDMLYPISYALPVGLFGTLIHELVEAQYITNDAELVTAPYMTALLLLGLTLWVESRVLQDNGVKLNSGIATLLFATTAFLAVPALVAPGILAGLLVALLGYHRRDLLLRGLAYVFFVGFVGHFYYALNTSLLTKSLTMIAVGVVLLVGRFGFRRMLPVDDAIEQTERSVL